MLMRRRKSSRRWQWRCTRTRSMRKRVAMKGSRSVLNGRCKKLSSIAWCVCSVFASYQGDPSAPVSLSPGIPHYLTEGHVLLFLDQRNVEKSFCFRRTIVPPLHEILFSSRGVYRAATTTMLPPPLPIPTAASYFQ